MDQITPEQKIQKGGIAIHRHTGVDAPKVRYIDLEGTRDYQVTFATVTISNGTASVQNFSTPAARFGDFTLHAAPYSLARVIVTSYVSGAGTTTVLAHNQSSGTVTLNQGNWNIRIIKRAL